MEREREKEREIMRVVIPRLAESPCSSSLYLGPISATRTNGKKCGQFKRASGRRIYHHNPIKSRQRSVAARRQCLCSKYTLHIYTLHSVFHTVLYTQTDSIQNKLHCTHSTQSPIHCTNSIQYIVPCTLYIQYTVHCPLYSSSVVNTYTQATHYS